MGELKAKDWAGAALTLVACGGLTWWALGGAGGPAPDPEGPDAAAPAPVEAAPATVSDAAPLTPSGTGRVTLQLLDEGGVAPEECLATLWELVDGKRRLHMGNSIRCDAEGDLAWEGLPAGSWRLMAQTKRSVMFDASFELTEGAIRAFGTVELDPGGLLMGTVSRDGAPVEGARVYLEGGRDVTTGPAGQFKLEGVPTGDRALLAGLGGFIDQQTVTIAPGEVTSAALELVPRGALGVRFHNAGLKVDEVHPGGPAADLLETGDVLVSIQGRPLDALSPDDARRALLLPAGAEISLEVQRGEHRIPVTLTLADAQTLQ